MNRKRKTISRKPKAESRKLKAELAAFLILLSIITMLELPLAWAAETKFEVSIDRRTAALGETVQLGLTFYGTQDVPAPDVGTINGLEIRYLGPSTMMTVLNGRISTSVTHMYRIAPLKTGKFQIGPFTFDHKGTTYSSNVVFLEVVEERLQAQQGLPQEEQPINADADLKERIYLTLRVAKTSAYVNELIPVTVKLYVNRLNVSDIQLPIFVQEGFSKVEFREPKQGRELVDGLVYDTLEFKTSIFGTKPGEYRLGPAKIKCNLITRKRVGPSSRADDFFGDEYNNPFYDEFMARTERRPMEVKSDDIPIIISPLPRDNIPAGFSGAIGDYQFIFNATPKKVKVGDPITLSMEINGTGNFNTVLMPRLDNVEGFKVYEPQVKTEAFRKLFTQILMPTSELVTQTPKAVFTYFDPKAKVFKTISQGPIPIVVEKGKEEAPAQVIGPTPGATSAIGESEEPKRNIIHIKDSIGFLHKVGYRFYKNRIFQALLPLPLLCLLIFAMIRGREDRLRRDTKFYGRVMAMRAARTGLRSVQHKLRQGDPGQLYETIFKVLQDYLGYRLGIPVAGVTYNAVEEAIASRPVDEDISRMIKNLFDMCDEARFGRVSLDDFRMKNDAKSLERVIRYFERVKL